MEIKLKKGQNNITFSEEKLILNAENIIDSEVFVSVDNGGEKVIECNFKRCSVNVFIWINTKEKLTLNENYNLFQDSNITFNFCDVYSKALTRCVNAQAIDKMSKCQLNTTVLATGTKKMDINAVNIVGDTSMNMENSSVAFDNADFELVASGVIKKNAKNAINFQSTRCLTIGKTKKVSVVPNLYIDENDVEAGHGCTVGDIDENVMYYLNSRGLNQSKAKALIIHSFLMTICENILDEEIKNRILDEIEKQVELCTII